MIKQAIFVFIAGLAIAFISHCQETDATDEPSDTETSTTDTGDSETGENDTTDTASEVPLPTCEDLPPCEAEPGSAFACPAGKEFPKYTCKRFETCGGYDTVLCSTEEEACLVECGHSNCMLLDSDPQLISCNDN